jgi:hypothetical protein
MNVVFIYTINPWGDFSSSKFLGSTIAGAIESIVNSGVLDAFPYINCAGIPKEV